MTLQQLKYALTIADCGSMNEAAKTLFLSQPSLSETIRELETEIGFDLFVRSNRGILVTAYASLTKEVSCEEVKAVYDKYYGDEYFVRVLEKDGVPQTRWVEGSNFADVNFKIDTRTNRVVMMGAIDNMVKGAAGQAIQNMNLMFGLPENTGLKQIPIFP